MIVRRYPAFVRFVALLAALPYPALLIDRGALSSAPAGATPAAISASDNPAIVNAASLVNRKSLAKGERLGAVGAPPAIAARVPVANARAASPSGVGALPTAHAKDPACAFLCRFLI